MTKTVRNIIIFVLAALVFAAIMITVTEKEQKELSANLAKLNQELAPYRVKQNNIESQINDLENEYDALDRGKGNIVLLYKNPNNKFYTSIVKKHSNYGVTGTIMLSKGFVPGQEGAITVDEFNQLVNAGWNYCIAWEEGDTPQEWKNFWEEKLAGIGVTMPKVVHFAKNTYSEEYDTFLLENGIDILIHQGVSGKYYIVTGCEEEIWDVCAVAWNDINAKTLMQKAVSKGGTLVFSVGTSGTEEYDDVTFDAMIDTVYDYSKAEKLVITDVLKAKENEIKIAEERQEEKDAISKQIEELQAQWDEIEKEMDKVYKSYKQKK